MKNQKMEAEIKELIIDSLNLEEYRPEDIKGDEALFGEGLGLDSIDALELGMALKRRFGVKLDVESDVKKHFYSVQSLASFISANQSTGASVEK